MLFCLLYHAYCSIGFHGLRHTCYVRVHEHSDSEEHIFVLIKLK